ncbi:MAG: cell division protein FtsA [Muribaculaceae bacterium]|nr:cell division protein FtsA [Muribaculaceae bacterium]
MNEPRYVAAIEISSSKIAAAVGRMHSTGKLEIIATDQEKGVDSVRYGILQNLEETSMRLNRIIDRLEHKVQIAPREIVGAYVGLSGRSLRSITTEVDITLPDDTEINDDILQRLREQALATAIDSTLEVVDAIPRVYYVGKLETRSPKGAIGNKIRAVYDLIVCRPELRRNLTRTIADKSGIQICGFVVTALSTAQVILTSEEKRLGCMLVDMGAETTSVSIYKDGGLRYFATLPLGGRNITLDVVSLNLLEERAEDIKITMGNAIARDTASSYNVNGIRMADVSNLIVARSEEIVANIVEQIKYAGMKDSDLPAGLICIGGASKLNGLPELLERQIDLPVRRGQLPEYIHLEDTKSPSSEILEVCSVLYSGAADSEEECLETPGAPELPANGQPNPVEEQAPAPEPRKTKTSVWSRFTKDLSRRVSDMFSGADEDDSDLI